MKTSTAVSRRRFAARRARGATLIETAAALAVMSLMLVFLVQMTQGESDRILAKNTADRLEEVTSAAKEYMAANYGALLTTVPAGGTHVVRAGRTASGGAVPADSLQDEGFLPPSFIDANRFGQRTALLVHKVDARTLEGLVTTYGGRAIPDRMLGQIANFVGPEGGYTPADYVSAADAGMILGTSGGWRTSAASWGAGATAPAAGTIQATTLIENGELLKDYLYRKDIGVPEANRMYTDIDMNRFGLSNVGRLSGVNDAVTGARTVVIGEPGDPNSLRATLDVWADRDVHAENDVTADRDVTAGRNVVASGDVTARGNVAADGNVIGEDVTARGLASADRLEVAANASVGADLDVVGKVTAGDVDADLLSMDAVIYGSEESQSGGRDTRFTPADGLTLGDLLPKMVAQYSYVVRDGDLVPKPVCKGGDGNSRIMIYRQLDSVKGTFAADGSPAFTTNVQATSAGRFWAIEWVGDAVDPSHPRQSVAQTFCFYG